MYKITFHAYCGMPIPIEETDDRAEARKIVAEYLKERRFDGYPVTTLQRGERWEILEPKDSAIVSDDCGILRLKHITYECRECGSRCETQEDAYQCCAEREYIEEDYQ